MVGATRGIVHQFRDDWKASIPKEMAFKRGGISALTRVQWHGYWWAGYIIVIIFTFREVAIEKKRKEEREKEREKI